MKKRFILILCMLFVFLFLTACGGPSDDKINTAQATYQKLAKIHNQVMDAHRNISDKALDQTLTALAEKIEKIQEFNLKDMTDEQVDILIGQMNEVITSYDNCLSSLTELKAKEDAAVLVPIPVSLINKTGYTFTMLKLYQADQLKDGMDILTGLEPFTPGQTLTGIVIQKDVSGTDWNLIMQDEEGTDYSVVLPVTEYPEAGVCLTVSDSSEGITITAQ